MTCCNMPDFCAFCCRSERAVFCTPGTSEEGGTYLEIEEIALRTALCGSDPGGNSGKAPPAGC